MAAATSKASWIARQWKTGWDKLPLLMAAHCVTIPLLFLHVITSVTDSRFRIRDKVEKYRVFYTVVRSDDPRVANINKDSSIDKVGIFS